MLRSAASKVMWVGRATVFLVGLAVILALVVGLASSALAHTNVDTKLFHLGHNNPVAKLSKLTGNLAGAVLKVDNNGTGPALSLEAQAGKAPMTVNATAGKATNLNADKLDGKSDTDFYAAGSKVADSDNLDGQDASSFATDGELSAEANTRANADNNLDTRATSLETKMSVFNAAEVIDAFGPLPKQGTYTSKGGTLIISASGSGYRNSTLANGLIGMQVKVDGTVRGQATTYTNERSSHKAFVDDYIVVKGLAAGQHTILLERLFDTTWCGTQFELDTDFCTVTDNRDSFRVTVLEIPA